MHNVCWSPIPSAMQNSRTVYPRCFKLGWWIYFKVLGEEVNHKIPHLLQESWRNVEMTETESNQLLEVRDQGRDPSLLRVASTKRGNLIPTGPSAGLEGHTQVRIGFYVCSCHEIVWHAWSICKSFHFSFIFISLWHVLLIFGIRVSGS